MKKLMVLLLAVSLSSCDFSLVDQYVRVDIETEKYEVITTVSPRRGQYPYMHSVECYAWQLDSVKRAERIIGDTMEARYLRLSYRP